MFSIQIAFIFLLRSSLPKNARLWYLFYLVLSRPLNSHLFDFFARMGYFLQFLFKNIQNVIKDIFFDAQNTKQV